MSLSAFAILVGAPVKWCQNALEVLGLPLHYTPAMARQLGLTRLLNDSHSIPLKTAFRLAREALSGKPLSHVARADEEGISTLTVDVNRYLSLFAVRLSAVRVDPPRGRGRPARARPRGERAAEAHGIDISALRAGLGITPAERLEALDASQRLVERLRSGRRVQ
jgi:hypothetical protein